MIKNFSPVRNYSNKLSLKKKQHGDKISENQKNNNKKNNNNSNYQTSSQFIKYKTLKPYLNKANNNNMNNMNNINNNNNNNTKTVKSINTNNYIINTLNLSEKKIINSSLEKQNETMDLEINIKKIRKEKEELEKKASAQKKLIQKLIEDNEKMDNKYNEVYEDNIRLRNKLNSYKDTQEQLIMLIKLVQKTGVDVEGIIDKWNNEVENDSKNEENDNEIENKNKSAATDIQNNYDYKLDSSFTPITIDENPKEKNEKIEIVPKLNFSNLHSRIRNIDNKQYNNNTNINNNKENNKEGNKGNKRNLSQGNINQDIENQEKGIEIINKKMEGIKRNKNHNSKKSISQDKK